MHSDYRPQSRWLRSVWRNHRLHHYKNEHYWFTVTTAGTADRLFGTYPEPADGHDLADREGAARAGERVAVQSVPQGLSITKRQLPSA